MSCIALKARYICPIDRPPIVGGMVTISGDRIEDVGQPSASSETRDLGDVAILPGFVNAHTHLQFSHLREPLGVPGIRLPEWIRLVIAERNRKGAERTSSVELGLLESARRGTTTLGDIAGGALADDGDVHQVDARRRIEMTVFHEVIGFSSNRAQSVFDAVRRQLDAIGSASTHRLGISPHAPYTVHPRLLSQLVRLATDRHLPLAMHLAESPEELELLQGGTGPFRDLLVERSMWDSTAIPHRTRPLDYLRTLSQSNRSLVIHGNYLDREELEYVASCRERMFLIYCPRTHAFFGHKPYPLSQAVSLGVRVALGTDSRASNPNLSIWEEVRFLAGHHSGLSPQRLFQMATLDGAAALGREHVVGSLSSGKFANLTVIRLPERVGTESDVYELLFDEAARVDHTWYRGVPNDPLDADRS